MIRRFFQIIGVLSILILLVSVIGVYFAVYWLKLDTRPVQSDIIILLSGNYSRARYGADLYNQAYAPQVLISRARPHPQQADLEEIGISLQNGAQIYRQILLKKGVPAHAIGYFGQQSISTMAEARALAKHLQQKPLKLLIVTSAYHTRRVQMVFEDLLPNADIVVVSTPYEPLPERWWQDYDAARNVILELSKVSFYLLGGEF
ncbi:MAG: hypothetical protein BMS9Abin26_1757 [Gammaproteobacteria bacterium]|nr:MAG: hypothetical protein BMS9Abin26_1757 [Gammaproteobacteria bacterium]